MADFPGSIPSFQDFNPATSLAANNHAARHNKVHAEVDAIAEKVGTNGSVDPASHTKQIADLQEAVQDLQSGSTNSVYENVTPSGAIDGSNVTFTVPHTFIINSLKVYKNGVRLKSGAGNDYVETTGGFTMAVAPATGTRVLVDYMVSAGISNNADTVDGYHATDIIAAAKQAMYPVGSIYLNATDGTNPATLLGFGTWTAFGAGRVPVGIDISQVEFDTAGETGGAKTHTLTTAEMPAHAHRMSLEFGTNANLNSGPPGQYNQIRANGSTYYTAAGQMENTGGGGAHNNLQPYVVVYMWRRTA